MYNRASTRGFTLIELLVVIAIIGILTSIITVSLSTARQKSRDAKRVADLKSIQLALSLYYNDNYMYPKNIYGTGSAAPDMGLAPNYIASVPKDPNANLTDNCASTGANGLASCYKYNGYTTSSGGICNTTNNPLLYHLGAVLEDSSNTVFAQDMDGDATLSNIFTSTTYYRCTNSPSPSSAFHGGSTGCATTASSPDSCYDVTP